MNYAKVVGAALTLFPKKITVTVIDELTKNEIGKYKIPLAQLPTEFDKPTILEIEGRPLRVVQADPVKADDFSFTKKLKLLVLQKQNWQDERLLFNVPTRHAYHPLTTQQPLYNEFTVDLQEDDWRQLEFLPITALPAIEAELALIDLKTADALWGYKALHVREQTAQILLSIPLTDFCSTVQARRMGAVKIYGNAAIDQCVAIESDNYTYYGIVSDDKLISLCLPSFDCIDDEFMNVVTTFGLVLVDWCGGRVVMIDTGAPVEATAAQGFDSDLSPI